MMAFEKASGKIPRAVYKEKIIFWDKVSTIFLLKDLLEFIKGLRDHMKKKKLVNRRVHGFSASCQHF